MQACYLTITTIADEIENKVSKNAEIELGIQSATLRYEEDTASVVVYVQGETVTIERNGDYSLFLPLKSGETTVGTLGIGASKGALSLYTHKVNYAINEDSLLLLLQYDMIMGEETQRMKLRLLARLR